MKVLKYLPVLMVLIFAGCGDNGEDKSVTPEAVDGYFIAVEEMPEPIGGIEGIQEKVKYPEIPKRAGIEGKVFVKAYIDESGNVAKTEIVKGLGAGLDEAAERAIKDTRFKPGKQRGKKVKTVVMVPIVFKLEKDSAQAKEKKNSSEMKADITKIMDEYPDYFSNVDKLPQPVGGISEIASKLVYPELAKKAGIEGKVFVVALIGEDGRVDNVELLNRMGRGFDEAAIKAVRDSKFTPAEKDGKQVKSLVTIPIAFKLK